MARGIERRKIFWDDKDRTAFLERFGVILEETQTQCYAWALIPNHFHILLRTGATPLSTVMRRLMTGYAVTFNIRHKRSGHLFQNRYKSVVCEEDPYLLELIRYIHLNPLRAKLVEDLKTLDKYPWAGHSAILGRRKNPFLTMSYQPSVISSSDRSQKSLAEKTVEDVLQYFGKSLKEARRKYRVFVEKGIKQGRRTDLQGGGLVRSAGGDKTGLLGQKEEDKELSDQRILGSGDFVAEVLRAANEFEEKRIKKSIPIDQLADKITSYFDIKIDDILIKSQKSKISKARSIICYLAIKEMKYSGTSVGKFLNIRRYSALRCAERGRNILDKDKRLWDLLGIK
ncbi:MAG: transposase [Deltaproteobacteria bacterium]|nr:transposase [Deltaproteobacteria bacterium]